jgi:hypothetical protein
VPSVRRKPGCYDAEGERREQQACPPGAPSGVVEREGSIAVAARWTDGFVCHAQTVSRSAAGSGRSMETIREAGAAGIEPATLSLEGCSSPKWNGTRRYANRGNRRFHSGRTASPLSHPRYASHDAPIMAHTAPECSPTTVAPSPAGVRRRTRRGCDGRSGPTATAKRSERGVRQRLLPGCERELSLGSSIRRWLRELSTVGSPE